MHIKKHYTEEHHVDLLFILLVFSLFTATVLAVILLGIKIYRNTLSSMDNNYTTRISYSYIAEKIRQNDVAGSITCGSVDGTDALVMTTLVGEKEYATYIYAYDGYIKELLISTENDPDLESGTNIIKGEDISFSFLNATLLEITYTGEEGTTDTFYLSTRSNQN